MIGAIHGRVANITNQQLLVLVGGVGYQIAVATPTTYTVGDQVELWTYLAVRETALDLYGFTTMTDKQLFELLLTVPKIGPKSALQVLSQAPSNLLSECIQDEDPSRLHKQAGVGKKTAENIVATLKDKLGALGINESTNRSTKQTTTQADAIDALVSLGFDAKTAREHIAKWVEEDLSVSELVARALK